MSNEVNGTAQNSAGAGGNEELKTANNIHFDGAALATGSDAAIQALIAEFQGLSQKNSNLIKIELHVLAVAGVPPAVIEARVQALTSGMEAAGLVLDDEFEVLTP